MSQRGHTQNTNSKKALKDTVSIKKISQGGHPTAETITALSREWDAFKGTIRRNPFMGKHIYHEKKILRIKFGVIKKKTCVFVIENLGEIEAAFENTLTCLSGAQLHRFES